MRTSFINKLTNLLLAIFLVAVGGCGYRGLRGNGIIASDQRTIAAFTILEANGAFQIEWQPGAPSLTVTTDQNLLSRVETTVVGNKLLIEPTERLAPTHGIKVVVSSPGLTGVQLSGAVRFTAKQLAGEKFYIDTTGATRLTADGKVNQMIASMTGASRLDASALQTKIAELSLTGASRADVAVAESLKVAISGAGKVNYSGNPRTVEKEISGAGKISKRD
jgi:hypothetical protein